MFLGSCAREDTAVGELVGLNDIDSFTGAWVAECMGRVTIKKSDGLNYFLPFQFICKCQAKGRSSSAFSKLLVFFSRLTLLIESECVMSFAISVCDQILSLATKLVVFQVERCFRMNHRQCDLYAKAVVFQGQTDQPCRTNSAQRTPINPSVSPLFKQESGSTGSYKRTCQTNPDEIMRRIWIHQIKQFSTQ